MGETTLLALFIVCSRQECIPSKCLYTFAKILKITAKKDLLNPCPAAWTKKNEVLHLYWQAWGSSQVRDSAAYSTLPSTHHWSDFDWLSIGGVAAFVWLIEDYLQMMWEDCYRAWRNKHKFRPIVPCAQHRVRQIYQQQSSLQTSFLPQRRVSLMSVWKQFLVLSSSHFVRQIQRKRQSHCCGLHVHLLRREHRLQQIIERTMLRCLHGFSFDMPPDVRYFWDALKSWLFLWHDEIKS